MSLYEKMHFWGHLSEVCLSSKNEVLKIQMPSRVSSCKDEQELDTVEGETNMSKMGQTRGLVSENGL